MKRITPRARSIIGWVVAIIFVLAVAALCWHNIHQALDNPIQVQLVYSGTSALPPVSGGSAVVRVLDNSAVTGELTHASAQLQWLITLSDVNSSLLLAAVVLVFGIVWVRTSSGRPFARTVTRALSALSIIVAVFGTTLEMLNSWVGMREGYDAVGNFTEASRYYSQSNFQITGVSIYIALAIGVLASAFAIGARLTRERAALADELQGLV
jgi:cytochrome bd-type quinol oxidase subunit 2